MALMAAAFTFTPVRVARAFMDAFGLEHDDLKMVKTIDLHVSHNESTLTVTYILKAPDLSEVKKSFRIVPVDEG